MLEYTNPLTELDYFHKFVREMSNSRDKYYYDFKDEILYGSNYEEYE